MTNTLGQKFDSLIQSCKDWGEDLVEGRWMFVVTPKDVKDLLELEKGPWQENGIFAYDGIGFWRGVEVVVRWHAPGVMIAPVQSVRNADAHYAQDPNAPPKN